MVQIINMAGKEFNFL